MKPKQKAVSLADELSTLASSAEGALLLLDDGSFTTIDANPTAAAKAIVAVLASRLRQVARAVRGTIDPAVLHAAHNATDAVALGHEDPDVRLPAGGSGKESR